MRRSGDAANHQCADTGAPLKPADTWVNPTLGIFLSAAAAKAHQAQCAEDDGAAAGAHTLPLLLANRHPQPAARAALG